MAGSDPSYTDPSHLAMPAKPQLTNSCYDVPCPTCHAGAKTRHAKTRLSLASLACTVSLRLDSLCYAQTGLPSSASLGYAKPRLACGSVPSLIGLC